MAVERGCVTLSTHWAWRGETRRPDGCRGEAGGGEASCTLGGGGGGGAGWLAFVQTPLLPVTSSHKHMEALNHRQGKCVYLLWLCPRSLASLCNLVRRSTM